MKKTIYAFIIIAAVIFTFWAAPLYAGEKNKTQRRFQLFNAEYNSSSIQLSKTTIFLEKRLFKIDTQTGETWMLFDVLKDGRDIKYWRPIKVGGNK